MPQMNVSASHTAAIVALPDRLSEVKGGWGNIALTVGALSAGFIPFVGSPIMLGLEKWRNNRTEEAQKEVLAEYYRDQVAQQLGVNPARVSVGDLELAAQVNPMLRGAIAKVEEERKSSDRATWLTVGAGAATGGIFGGLGGFSHLAAHAGVAIGAGMVSSLFDKDVLFVQDVMNHIEEKKKEGLPIETADVFSLRVAQDEHLQAQIKEKTGKYFHKMSTAEQQAVMRMSPELMASSAQEAQAVYNGSMTPQDLVAHESVVSDEVRQNWTSRVGNTRKSFASFAEAEKARAAERAMMGQQVS